MSAKLNAENNHLQGNVKGKGASVNQKVEQSLQCLRVQRNAVHDPSMQTEWSKKKLVWVPSEKEGFVVGSIKEERNDDAVIEILETGKIMTLSKDDYQRMNPPKFDKVEDMAELTCLNEASVLHNLKERYYSDLIYTYSGLFCVVVNPYKRLPIYSETLIDTYKGRKRNLMPPHIFAIADTAYRSMLSEHEDQSILCTGESGAGKTENTKKVIQYLASVAGSAKHGKSDTISKGELEQQLLQANPILEAFGNSKTVKNDNSSRFGKFIRINFDMSGFISGGNIEFYLLEKSRTCRQAADERSFHVFYQLLKGASNEEKKNLLLMESDQYRYLNNGYISLPNVDDGVEYKSTIKAMQIMGFQNDEIDSIFKIVSTVLLFGNIEFTQEKKSDQAAIIDDSVAQKVCHLLGIPVQEFTKSLLRPRIKVGREFVQKAQSKEQAEFSVEAISKACYEQMFKWLVSRLNKSLDRTRRQGASFIGILDIAGFEIFQINSFEQLCINYTNEKLQQLFNNTMFVLEQEEYQREGIDWKFIDFGLDLQPTIDLIDKHMGVLALLDEECLFPKATDRSLVEKLAHNHDKNTKFLVSEMRSKSDFAIIHYAGRVDYSADQWLMKNMDPLNENVVSLMQNSSDAFVSSIWKDAEFAGMGAADASSSAFGARSRKGMFRTVSQVYKDQLAKLMATLRNTVPHFVRCIIPNHEKKPGKVSPLLVLEQLRCNGVLEGIRICRQGFPNRIPFQDFRHRYEILAPNAIPKSFMDGKKSVKKIIENLDLDVNLYRIGQSKIFFRAGVLAKLEEERDLKLTDLIVRFQAICRGFLAKKRFKMRFQQSNAIRLLQRNGLSWLKLRNWQWWRLFTKVKPLLQVTNAESELSAKNDELRSAQAKLEQIAAEAEEVKTRNATLTQDRQLLAQQLQQESEEKAEIEDFNERMKARVSELENVCNDLTARLEDEDQKIHLYMVEKERLTSTVRELESQIGDKENNLQKIQLEKQNVDKKSKVNVEQMAELKDAYEKLLKEKKILDDRSNEMNNKLIEEEDKSKAAMKQRAKNESHLQDLEQEIAKEREQRSEIEKARRRIEQDLNEQKELIDEKTEKLVEMSQQLMRHEEEIAKLLAKSDDDAATIIQLKKQIRDCELQIEELKDDLETEKDACNKAERSRRDLAEELESLKTECIDAADKTAFSLEIQKKKDEELLHAQRSLETQAKQFREKQDETKTQHQEQIELLRDQLEQVGRLRAQMEKSKISLENQNKNLAEELATVQQQKQESEKKRKALDVNSNDLQSKYADAESSKHTIMLELQKLHEEYDLISKQKESDDQNTSVLERQIASLEMQLHEMNETLQDETRQKLSAQTKIRTLEDAVTASLEKDEELLRLKSLHEREVANLRKELADARKKAEEANLQQFDEFKKKAQRDLEAALKAGVDADASRDRTEKSKKKLQQELEDVNIELENTRSILREIEKKQRKFDQQILEERSNFNNAVTDKDQLAQECREKETKILNMGALIDNLRADLEESDRIKKMVQIELDDLVSNKDDYGRNVHELEKNKRLLEAELLHYKSQVEELDEAMQNAEDHRLRQEVNSQALKNDFDRNLAAKEQEGEEKRKLLQKTIRELEDELEIERRNKLSNTNQRKKLETQLSEMEIQLENSNKLKDDFNKQLKKLQSMLRDAQAETEEARQTRDENGAILKEVERKLRTLESDNLGLSEQYASMLAIKRNLEAELAELEESIKKGAAVSPEDKRRYEGKISQLEDELEEEQSNVELVQDKLRKAQSQVEQLTSDISAERSHGQKSEADKQNLERVNRELKAKMMELESSSQTRSRTQIAALETKITFLEEQVAAESTEKTVLTRKHRRLEKKLVEATLAAEDEKRNADQAKETAERSTIKQRQMRRQIDEFEEEIAREKTKTRALQRERDDLNETNETLNREVLTLRSSVNTRRTNLRRPASGSRNALASAQANNSSSDNLQHDSNNESNGTDGTF
uniref:Myosin motor domain-containing protein n=1 Tax=Rhabditophanes sp. KR3021 TaxID=114890 RepID=A0AC35UHW0_9BILA